MDGRRNNSGKIGNKGGGRRPARDERKLVERLTPMADTAHRALKKALEKDEPWAVKLWFEYFYGKPHQSQSVTLGKTVNIDPKEWVRNPPSET